MTQIIARLPVIRTDSGEQFVSAVYRTRDCACKVIGDGTLQAPFDIQFCEAHAAINAKDDILLEHIRNGSNWVTTFHKLQKLANPAA